MRRPRSSAARITFTAVLLVAAALLVSQGCGTSRLRLPLNRPSLEPYRTDLAQPRSTDGAVTVRFLGVTSLAFQDGRTTILSDGFISRPGSFAVATGRRIAPDMARIQGMLDTLRDDSVAAVFLAHSHYDHAMDAPTIAHRTGALLLGTPHTKNVARGFRTAAGDTLPSRQHHEVRHGEVCTVGTFELTFLRSRHSPDNQAPGRVDTALRTPAKARAWKSDDVSWSVLVRHGARRILVHPSAFYDSVALAGHPADVVYLGIGGLGKRDSADIDRYLFGMVKATQAKRMILVHWDDPTSSLENLRALFYKFDSFGDTMRHVERLKAQTGVDVRMPVAWQPTDPFAGLALATGSESQPAVPADTTARVRASCPMPSDAGPTPSSAPSGG